ncbi:hypothetical protein BKA70DRAFT_1530651, partial [Coprinopsis sp. MPI-PUGE-AT-0042]
MDNRDDDSLSSSLPSSLIPHLYTGPQDSSTRTTLSDDFPRNQTLPPLDPRLAPQRTTSNFDHADPPGGGRILAPSPTALMDRPGAVITQPTIPLPSSQRFGSPIYSDPVFHASRPSHIPRQTSFSQSSTAEPFPDTAWREGEAGPSSSFGPPRNHPVWLPPDRQGWQAEDRKAPSVLPSVEDPVWGRSRSFPSRDDTAAQQQHMWSSHQRDSALWQESVRFEARPTFEHGASTSAPDRTAFQDPRYARQEGYHDMSLIEPDQALQLFDSVPSTHPLPSRRQIPPVPTQPFYASPQSSSSMFTLQDLHGSGPERNPLSTSPDPRLGAFSGYETGTNSETSSQKGKKSRSTVDSREDNTRRPKTSVACDFCRGRKLRCDGDKPCSNCRGRGYECVYVHFQRRRGPGKNPKGARAKKRAAQAGGSSRGPSATPTPTRVDTGSGVFPMDLSPNPGSLPIFQTSPPQAQEFSFQLPLDAPSYPFHAPRSHETSSEDRSDAEEMYRRMG